MKLKELKIYIKDNGREVSMPVDFTGQKYPPKERCEARVWLDDKDDINYATPTTIEDVALDISTGRMDRTPLRVIAVGRVFDSGQNYATFDEKGNPTMHVTGGHAASYLREGEKGYSLHARLLGI